jgi:translation initiation factor 1A
MQYHKNNNAPEEHRLVMPHENEVVGVVIKALGASKFSVLCSDNNERICAIPGRLRRRFWIKENDMVLVKPWVVQGNEKGDIVYRYSIMDKESLKQKGINVPEV